MAYPGHGCREVWSLTHTTLGIRQGYFAAQGARRAHIVIHKEPSMTQEHERSKHTKQREDSTPWRCEANLLKKTNYY